MAKVVYTLGYDGALTDVDAAIAAAVAGQSNANRLIQHAAIAVLCHAYKCGDYSKAQVLVDSLEGANRKSLVDWFCKFGGLEKDGKKFSGWKGKAYIKARSTEARETAWWGEKPDNPYAGFNFKDAIEAVISSQNKHLKGAKGNDDKMALIQPATPEQIAQIRAILLA